jgi:hypothetical protein
MTKQQQIKLKVAMVKMGAIGFEGLLNPETGEYRVAVQQVGALFQDGTQNSVRPDNIQKSLKRLFGEGFQFVQAYTARAEGSSQNRPENTISLQQFRKVIRHFDRKGNSVAQNMMDMLMDVSLENVFNDAFGIENSPENNQKIANETLQAKYEEILNNDSLDDFEKQVKVNIMFAQHDLEKAQAQIEKHKLKKKLLKEEMELEKIKDFLRENARELNLNLEELDDVAEQVTSFFQTVFNNIDYLNQTEKEWYPVRTFIINKFSNYFKEGQHKVIGKICGQLHQKLDILQKYRASEYRSDLIWAVCNAAKEYTQIKMKLVLDCAKKCLEIRLENDNDKEVEDFDFLID